MEVRYKCQFCWHSNKHTVEVKSKLQLQDYDFECENCKDVQCYNCLNG